MCYTFAFIFRFFNPSGIEFWGWVVVGSNSIFFQLANQLFWQHLFKYQFFSLSFAISTVFMSGDNICVGLIFEPHSVPLFYFLKFLHPYYTILIIIFLYHILIAYRPSLPRLVSFFGCTWSFMFPHKFKICL